MRDFVIMNFFLSFQRWAGYFNLATLQKKTYFGGGGGGEASQQYMFGKDKVTD